MTPADRTPAPMLNADREERTAAVQMIAVSLGVVDRCVCRNVTFAEVAVWLRRRRAAGEANVSLDAACDALTCSDKCRMCRPYLERVHRGEGVSFEVE